MPQTALATDLTLQQRLQDGLVCECQREKCQQLLVIDDLLQKHAIFNTIEKLVESSLAESEFGLILRSNLASALASLTVQAVDLIYLRAYAFDGPIFCEGSQINNQLTGLAGVCERFLLSPPLSPLPDEFGAATTLTFVIPQTVTEQETMEINAGLQSILVHGMTSCSHPVTVLSKPVLLTANEDTTITFSSKPVFGANITFNNALRAQPFRFLPAGEILGWSDYGGLAHLSIVGERSHELTDFFNADDNAIRTKTPLMLLWLNAKHDDANGAWVACFIDARNVITSV